MSRIAERRVLERVLLFAYLSIQLAMVISLVEARGVFAHPGMDFLPSYAGAQMLVDGGRNELYDTYQQWIRQQPIMNQYGSAWPDRTMHPYIAPPQLAMLTVPLLLFSPLVALLVWTTLNAVSVVVAVTLLARRLKLDWIMLALVVLIAFPAFYTVYLGQVEGILLLAMVVFLLELRRGNEVRAALALSLLALKPQLLLVPLVFLVVTGRRKALVAAVCAGTAQLLAAVAVIGSSGLREYVELGRRFSSPEGVVATNVPGMVNVRSIIVRAFPTWDSGTANVVILLVSISMIVVAGWLWHRMGDKALSGAGYSLLVITTLLTSYHALYHTAILAVLAVVFLIEAANVRGDAVTARRLVYFSWVFFSFGPLLAFLRVANSHYPALIGIAGSIIVWILAVRMSIAEQQPVIESASAAVPISVTVHESHIRDS